MPVEFGDDDLRRLYEESSFRAPGLGIELTQSYRKVVGFLVAASDERDLRSMKSRHFEKLDGDRNGQYSLRIHKQWRLIFRLETIARERHVVVIEIVDYH